MYYAEKVTKRFKKLGQDDYLKSMPQLLKQTQVDPTVGLNAMYILSPALMEYIKAHDSTSTCQTAFLVKQLGTAIQRMDSISKSQLLYNNLLLIDIAYSAPNFEHQYNGAATLQNHMESLKATDKDQAANFIDLDLVRLGFENYFTQKSTDSFRTYIARYEVAPAFGKSQLANVAEFNAKLHVLKGYFEEVYEWLTDALRHERDLQSELMTESSNLLYAYTQANHSGVALQKAETVQQQRTLWLVIILFFSLICLPPIFLFLLRRNRKAKQQIETLNNAANIAMEDAKHQEIKEEQQRFGKDSVTTSIAGIRHPPEILPFDNDDVSLKSKLGSLQTEVNKVYNVDGNKRHEWFNAASAQEEGSFAQRIRPLADSILSERCYKKDIRTADRTLLRGNADTWITLHHIKQVAITNIIKHTKAKGLGILNYKEDENLQLVINDDRKELAGNKSVKEKSTIGLQSIRHRVHLLNGQTTVRSRKCTRDNRVILVADHT